MLIDEIVSNYGGWSIEYVLDQPYSKLRELRHAIRLRKHVDHRILYILIGLAQGGKEKDVRDFFDRRKPIIPATEAEAGVAKVDGQAMDLLGLVFKQE